MVKAGITAKQALLAIEEARYLPDLGVGVTAKWVNSPGVTDQSNPFSYDPFNYAYATAGLVFRWKLDFLPQSARVDRAAAELEEMRATERFALGGVGVEVEKAYAEAIDAKTRLNAWARATQYAKRWLIQVQQGQQLGLAEDSDLVEPAKEYALKRFSEMSATFDYNVALAQLAVATGWDELASGSRE
jgi:outer membrane protein TolC